MDIHEFVAKQPALTVALATALEQACNSLDFDLRCIDWFVSSPEVADFYIEQKNRMAA